MKIKMRKTENQASAEFKYLENNQLYGKHFGYTDLVVAMTPS